MTPSGSMDPRELWTLAVETLERLLDDDLVLARAVRTRDYRRLYAVATIARRGLDEAMAMTDPYLYQRLSRAIVLMNLKGYGGLDIDKLRTLVEEGSAAAPQPAT